MKTTHHKVTEATTLNNQPDSPAEKRLQQVLCQQLLELENRHYANSCGVSQNNAQLGFVPAFCNTRSGTSVISRFADGRPAPIHILDGLPKAWIRRCNNTGQVTEAHPSVIAGFLYNGCFYTREEAASLH